MFLVFVTINIKKKISEPKIANGIKNNYSEIRPKILNKFQVLNKKKVKDAQYFFFFHTNKYTD